MSGARLSLLACALVLVALLCSFLSLIGCAHRPNLEVDAPEPDRIVLPHHLPGGLLICAERPNLKGELIQRCAFLSELRGWLNDHALMEAEG